jgi:hypothetical protein
MDLASLRTLMGSMGEMGVMIRPRLASAAGLCLEGTDTRLAATEA